MRVQRVTQTIRSWPRGAKEDLQQGDVLAKKIERIRWRLWHGRPQGALDLIGEVLQELEMPNRQVQLTAAYLKKLTGVLWDLETYVSGHSPRSSIMPPRGVQPNQSQQRQQKTRFIGCWIGG